MQNRTSALEQARRRLAQQSAAWREKELQLLRELATYSSEEGAETGPNPKVQDALEERKSLQESVTRLEAALIRAEEKAEQQDATPVLALSNVGQDSGSHVMQTLFDLASNALFIAMVVSKIDGSLGMSLTATKPPPGSSQPSGISVKTVVEGGAAEAAGIRPGDLVCRVYALCLALGFLKMLMGLPFSPPPLRSFWSHRTHSGTIFLTPFFSFFPLPFFPSFFCFPTPGHLHWTPEHVEQGQG